MLRSFGRRWVQMLGLLGLRVPPFELEEIIQLSGLIALRMKDLETGADARHDAWVASRFRYPLRSVLIKASRSSVLYVALTMVVVAGGFATSGIAAAAGAGKGASTSTAWVVFSIGLVVALAGAVSQQFRFGYRSSERRTLAVSLREEGWHFVYRAEPYSDDTDALGIFQSRVDEIHRQIAQVATVESEPTRKAASAARAEKADQPKSE